MQFVASRRSGGPLGPIAPWFLTGTSRRNPECPLGPAVASRVLTGTFGQAQVLTRTCRPVRGEGKREPGRTESVSRDGQQAQARIGPEA